MGLPLMERLPLGSSTALLDVGTGTGGLLPHLRKSAPHAAIFGVDRSQGMIRSAQRVDRSFLAVSDIQELALRSDLFDVAILMFMLFHVPSPLRGLQECARILRSGGRVGLTTWAVDPGLPGVQIWTEELDRCGAEPDPRDSAVNQHGAVNEPEKINRLLEAAGFRNNEIWTRAFAKEWDADSLMFVQQACGLPARRLASVPADTRAACVARVRDRIARLSGDDLIWKPVVLFAVAEHA